MYGGNEIVIDVVRASQFHTLKAHPFSVSPRPYITIKIKLSQVHTIPLF